MTPDPTKDRVEREIVIRGTIERVFAALTDPALFPTWGPEKVMGTIAAGEVPILDFGPGGKAAVYVVAVEAPRYFAYRWAQGATDPEVLLRDPRGGPSTLVEFHLEELDGGTRVRVVESGIAALPRIPGIDVDAGLDGMGKGWELMIGGLARSFEQGEPGDRIDNERIVAAPRERVYAALVAPAGWWAKEVEGTLAPGARATLDFGPFGRVTVEVVAAEAPGYLAYRWRQGRDVGPDTLVEYRLEEAAEGTRLRQSESGFDALPDAAQHWKRAHQGWGIILGLLEHHLEPR